MFGAVFWLTYTVATPISNWLATWVLGTLDALAAATLGWAPPWLYGLITDGLIHGVGTVFTFLPILVIFFAVLGVLEDVGYLSRGAYVMDRFMHLMGLHGKSFMPLFLGFGCNVPAVLGARIIEDRRARLLTILLAPLVPCTARLAVVAFLTPAFFPAHAAFVSWGLVALSLLVLAVAGIIVNKLAFHGEQTAFIMELPLYHVPNAAHHRTLCQKQHRQLHQEGRHADPDRLDGRVGAVDPARPRHRAERARHLRPRCWSRSARSWAWANGSSSWP